MADGVYVREPQCNTLRVHVLPAPTQPELDQIAWDLYMRVQQLVRERGLDWELPGDESGVLASVDPLLVDCATAAIQGTTLFGDRAGQRGVLQLGVVAGDQDHSSRRLRSDFLPYSRTVSISTQRAEFRATTGAGSSDCATIFSASPSPVR